jgi:hypothetical protein
VNRIGARPVLLAGSERDSGLAASLPKRRLPQSDIQNRTSKIGDLPTDLTAE